MNDAHSFNKLVHFSDPASSLNITDHRWNEIVQQQLKDFNDSNRKSSIEKLRRNRAIMEEQLKQIEEKRQNKSMFK
jgi:hypothetical protein